MKKLLIMLNLVTVSAMAQNIDPNKVIYGEDNRVDVYASTNSDFVELSKSTAAMINKNKVTKTGDIYKLNGSRTMRDRGLCESERFINQPSVASCSGFLVGDKYLVTAGHCIEDMSDCRRNYWVFDYKMKNETEANLEHTSDNVYKCKSIISTALTRRSKKDYALIELDRKVVGRTPLKFRKRGKAKVGDKLVVIGHPSGLPTKIADGAQVRKKKRNFFLANLDTYGGNSGSAVFNVSTGLVEGILVRGERDYRSSGGCTISNRVSDDGGSGEGVSYISKVKGIRNI